MKIIDVPIEDILGAYNDPNLQQAAVHFVALLKNFDRVKDDGCIYKMNDIAERAAKCIPYDEVKFNGEWSKEPSFVLMVTVKKMSELGFLPSISNPKDF
tara:strand:- start:349 stop:645 length:297 start_codon:yes stop_codon:yes gene_type:complete